MLEKMNPILDLVGRILMAVMFLTAGFSKFGAGYAGTQGYMESVGVPGMLLPLVILLEIAGALAIIAGFKTRTVAFLLAGFCFVSGVLFHFNPADQMQMILFMKNITIAGGFLFLLAQGPGAYALDNRSK